MTSTPNLTIIHQTTETLRTSARAAYQLLHDATASNQQSQSASSEFLQIRRQDVYAAKNEINNIHRQVRFLYLFWEEEVSRQQGVPPPPPGHSLQLPDEMLDGNGVASDSQPQSSESSRAATYQDLSSAHRQRGGARFTEPEHEEATRQRLMGTRQLNSNDE